MTVWYLLSLMGTLMACVLTCQAGTKITLSSNVERVGAVHLAVPGTEVIFTCKANDSLAVVWSAEPSLSNSRLRYTANDAVGTVKSDSGFEGRLTALTQLGNGRADFATTLTFQAEEQLSELVFVCSNGIETANTTLYLSETSTLKLVMVTNTELGVVCLDQTVIYACQAINAPYVNWTIGSLSSPISFTAADSIGSVLNEDIFTVNLTELSSSHNPLLANITTTLTFSATQAVNSTVVQCSDSMDNVFGVIEVVSELPLADAINCTYSEPDCDSLMVAVNCTWNQPMSKFNVTYLFSISTDQKQLVETAIPPGQTASNATISCTEPATSLVIELTSITYCDQANSISLRMEGREYCQRICNTTSGPQLGLLGLIALPVLLAAVLVFLIAGYLMIKQPSKQESIDITLRQVDSTKKDPSVPPKPPRHVECTELTPVSVKLTWKHDEKPTSFMIVVKDPRSWTTTFNSDISSYRLTGLTPGTEYSVSIAAVSENGTSDPETVSYTTSGIERPPMPEKKEITAHRAELVCPSFQMEPNVDYVLHVTNKDTKEVVPVCHKRLQRAHGESFEVLPDSLYEARIQARLDKTTEWSYDSEPLLFTTPVDIKSLLADDVILGDTLHLTVTFQVQIDNVSVVCHTPMGTSVQPIIDKSSVSPGGIKKAVFEVPNARSGQYTVTIVSSPRSMDGKVIKGLTKKTESVECKVPSESNVKVIINDSKIGDDRVQVSWEISLPRQLFTACAFELKVYEKSSNALVSRPVSISSDHRSEILYGLKPCTEYIAQITAAYPGSKTTTSTAPFVTKGLPSKPPMPQLEPAEEACTAIVKCDLRLKKESEKYTLIVLVRSKELQRKDLIQRPYHTIKVDRLIPGTEYKAFIKSSNVRYPRLTEDSDPLVFSAPAKPPKPAVIEMTARRVNFKFDLRYKQENEKYTLVVCNKLTDEVKKKEVTDEYLSFNTTMGTKYEATVKAVLGNNIIMESDTLEFTTPSH